MNSISNGNDEYLESIERQWGNFDPVDVDDDPIMAGLDKLLENQRKMAQLVEEQQELADEIRDSMREDGIGGY